MGLVDVLIILFLGLGAVIGFKRGFIKSIVIFIGTILVFYLAFKFKAPLASILYENFPFFDFKGLSSLNLLLYEGISFLILLTVLFIALRILVMVSGIIEKILKMTIILAIPSKILGIVVGVLQSYVIIYIILLVLSFPMFNIKMVKESKGREIMLEYTPILSKATDTTVETFDKIFDIKEEDIKTEIDKENADKQILEVLKESGIITKDNILKLIKEGKLKAKEE